MFSGCSLQASRPAPVQSATHYKSAHPKGSINTQTYRVKKGDTLYSIAWGAGTNFSEIAKLNQLDAPYIIYPGQLLKLHGTTSVTNRQLPQNQAQRSLSSSVVNVKTIQNQHVESSSVASRSQGEGQQKTLDPKPKPAYSVTSPQQDINRDIHRPMTTNAGTAKWSWPVRGKLIGVFSATEQGNKGIKIAGKKGEIIKAAADGRVVYAGDALRGYGNLVIIKHNDDFLSAYAHADKILVKEKQQVTSGQSVAHMGSTGTNQVMLHFEIRYLGQSVNPLSYLPRQ
jgi:lipoprotein NlpD